MPTASSLTSTLDANILRPLFLTGNQSRTVSGAMGKQAIIQVLLVDDSADIRRALHSILHSYSDVQVVGEATNGEEAVIAAEKLQPHVVLMDVNIPAMDGISATRIIKTRYPHIAVVGLSANTPEYMVYALVKAGAFAVMPKENAVEDLYKLILQAVAPTPFVVVPDTSTVAHPSCASETSINESEKETSRLREPPSGWPADGLLG